MIDFIIVAGKIIMTWFLVSFGMLYAFCPINDKDTTTAFRVTTLSVFAGLIYWVWR